MENELKILMYDAKNCLIIWKKKIWLIIAMAMLGFVAGNMLTSLAGEDEYLAIAKVSTYKETSDVLLGYSSLISSEQYCARAVEMLGDDFLTTEMVCEMVSISTTKGVPVVNIGVHHQDREYAMKIANALAKVAVNEMNANRTPQSAFLLDEATTTSIYSNSEVKVILIKVGCMILAACVMLAILGVMAIMSKRIETAEDFTCGGQLTVLGMIPMYKGK